MNAILVGFSLLATLCSCNEKISVDPQPQPQPQPSPEVVEVKCTPFDSRWQINSSYAANEENPWIKEGVCYATAGEGRSLSYITAESPENHELVFGGGTNIAVTGMQTGDYLLFGVPVHELAAGTDVEFMLTIASSNAEAPGKFVFEHFEKGSGWVSGRVFAVLKSNASNYSITSFVENFTTESAYQNDTLFMRCRVLEGGSAEGTIYFPSFNWEACRIFTYPADRFPAVIDTKKVMALGNSFSYYYGAVWMLEEIAGSQGHRMDLRMNLKPSQTLGLHLELQLSKAVVEEGGYDFALLQEQSTKHAKYADSPSSSESRSTLENTREMVNRIKAKSPSCKVFLESTWAYSTDNFMGYGSYERFDESLRSGTAAIAAEVGATVSPVGTGFAECRAAGLNEEWTDNKHQSEYGAYTKACINYLMIYGMPFTDTVSDCNLPSKAAQTIRTITQEIVLGK